VEDEIDPRYYIGVVAKYWKWILGLLVVAVALAALVSYLVLPPVYETAATVWVGEGALRPEAQPADSTQGDTDITSEAKNAAVRRQVLGVLGETLPEELRSLEALDQLFSVHPVKGKKTYQLKVRYNDPHVAADLANTWATVLVDKAKARYTALAEALDPLEQLTTAEEDLQAAEQALVEFQQTTSVAALEAVIEAQTEALADYERAETNVQLALQDANSLKRQLEATGSESPPLASALSALLIELSGLGAQSTQGGQIQISLDTLAVSELSVTEQIEHLDNLIVALGAKHQALVTTSEELLQKILKAQGDLQEARVELTRLQQEQDEARGTYESLSKKVEKAAIAGETEREIAQVVSVAETPVKPVSPRKLVNIAIAGILAVITGLFGAFIVEYLRQPSQAASQS
jgi:succinoglycan biosynthesis transport protein ExoP